MGRSTVYEISLKGDQYVQVAKKMQAEQDRLAARQKDLSKANLKSSEEYVRNAAALKENKAQLSHLTKQIQQNTAQQQSLSAITKKATKLMDQEAVTINELRNNNKQLLKIKNNLILTNKEEAKLAKKIDAQLDANNKRLKENSDAYTQQKMNIGNYSSALSGLNPKLQTFLSTGEEIVQGMRDHSTAMKASIQGTTGLTKAQKLLKVAMLSTGILAIVVALGSLYQMFTKTQKGADKLSEIFSGIGAVVDVIVDRLIGLGEILTNVFSQSLFTTLGQVKDNFTDIGDEIERDVRLAMELERWKQRLRDQENAQIVLQAQRNKMIEENRIIAKDEQKSISDRVAALRLAQELERANLAERLDIARQQAQIEQDNFDRATSNAEDEKKLQEAKAEVINLETQSLKLQRTLEAELQALLKRGRTEQEKAAAARQKEHQEEIDRYLDRMRMAEDEYDKEMERQQKKADEELERMRKSEGEYEAWHEEVRQMRLEAELMDFENEQARRVAQNESMFEIARTDLDRQFKLELAHAEKVGASVNKVKAKHAAISKQIDHDEKIARLQQASDTFGGVAEMLGEHTAAGKAAGIAQATINTYIGASEVWKSPSVFPEPYNTILKTVQTATTISSGLKAVDKIRNTHVPKAASGMMITGGMLQGRSHAEGGIQLEAEGGEAIINKRSMANPVLRGLASRINEWGGGKKFAEGGVIGMPSMPSITSGGGFTKDDLVDALQHFPTPVVYVEDINTGQAELDVVVKRASI